MSNHSNDIFKATFLGSLFWMARSSAHGNFYLPHSDDGFGNLILTESTLIEIYFCSGRH